MDRVAAEIAQEIAMLFEDDDPDPGAGQQQPQHHAGRTAPGDAAADPDLAVCHLLFPARAVLPYMGGGDQIGTGWRSNFARSSRAASFAAT